MNPYQVLGVSENATDEEIRAAYLALVKKYHPDKYQDNPLKNLADEKLKQINEAYDTIQKQRKASSGYGGYSGNYQGTGQSGYGTYQSGSGSGANYGYKDTGADNLNSVRQFLNSNNISRARSLLESMPNRNAEWHYLYGITLFRSGEYAAAKRYLEMAAQMEPSNAEYRSAATSAAAKGTRSYHNYGSRDTGSSDTLGTACRCCSTLWCLDSCCECMGGDLCRCC